MTSSLSLLRTFAHEHDDLPAFHAGYLVLTVLIAAMLNLGAFAVLIAAHMALDVVKYRERHGLSWARTAEGVLRESLVDITLLAMGLSISLYLHHSVGIAGISGLLRADLTIIRAAALLVPKIKILHDFLKIMSHLHHYMEVRHPRMEKGWNGFERLCLMTFLVSVLLLVFAVPLLHVNADALLKILVWELMPWNL